MPSRMWIRDAADLWCSRCAAWRTMGVSVDERTIDRLPGGNFAEHDVPDADPPLLTPTWTCGECHTEYESPPDRRDA